MPPRKQPATGLLVLFLMAFCAVLFLYGLERTPFRGHYDDVDRALIARTMADRSEWITPVYLGDHLYTKPPLMYWVTGGLYRLTGQHDELPAAMTSVLTSILVVLATFWAGIVLWGRRAALMAALILASSFLFVSMARQALLDTVMMAGFALSFGALIHLAFSKTRRKTFWWCMVTVGLAWSAMTKGPVLFPVLILAAIPLWRSRPRCLPSRRQFWFCLAIFAALVIPWHVILLLKHPEAWEVWRSELVGRIGSGPPTHLWMRRPAWFYILDLGHFLPWLLILPAALTLAFQQRQDRRYRMLLWWFLGGLAYFSLASETKRSYYLLPLYPALALLCGALWHRAQIALDALKKQEAHPPHWPRRLFLAGALLTAGLVLILGVAATILPTRYPLEPTYPFLVAGIIAILAGAGAITCILRRRWHGAFAGILAGISLIYLLYLGHVVPPVNAYKSGKPFYEQAATFLQPGRVAIYRANLAMTAFYLNRERIWNCSAPFHLDRTAVDGRGGWIVADPDRLEEIVELEPLHLQTLRSPFGQTRRMGLYRLPTDWRQYHCPRILIGNGP